MAEDIFAEDKDDLNKPEATEEELDKTDMGAGLMAERDPASVMPDPFAVDKAKAVDVIAKGLDQQISRAARETGKLLNAMPKDNVMIPVDKQNRHDEYVVAAINGFTFRIERGKKVALPRPVIDLLIDGDYGPTLVR